MRFTVGSGGFIGEVSVVEGELTDLFVHPLRRGKGWAHILMRKATKYADREGLRLKLRIHPFGKQTVKASRRAPTSEGLISLYKRHGFKRVNRDWMVRDYV